MLDCRLWVYFLPIETSLDDPLDANTIGSIASVASIDWAAAIQVMAAVNIGSDGTFEATAGQT
jgi:hypothetical protein